MTSNPTATVLPRNTQVTVRSVCLSSQVPGTTIEVRTQNSTYWVTPIAGATLEQGSKIRGLMVHTDSESGQRFAVSPRDVTGDDVITVGRGWRYGRQGRTTSVHSLRVV